MFGLGAGEILLILAFALIFIGPKKLPELARNLGKGIREFQRAKDDLMSQVRDEGLSNGSEELNDDSEELHDKREQVEIADKTQRTKEDVDDNKTKKV